MTESASVESFIGGVKAASAVFNDAAEMGAMFIMDDPTDIAKALIVASEVIDKATNLDIAIRQLFAVMNV